MKKKCENVYFIKNRLKSLALEPMRTNPIGMNKDVYVGLSYDAMRVSYETRTIDSAYLFRIKLNGAGYISGKKIILFDDLICSDSKNPQIIF